MLTLFNVGKRMLAAVTVVTILMLPAGVLAKGKCYQPSKWWQGWYNSDENPNHGSTCNVPEFSGDAAASAVALLIGGSFILLGRKRKVSL